jgi:hypothetical protein
MAESYISNISPFYAALNYELRKFLVEVPYTSVSQFYQFLGNRNADERYGVSCVWQAYMLGERLKQKKIGQISYYVDGRHVALICRSGNQQYLIDPYLLHTDPLEIKPNAVPESQDSNRSSAHAYPFRSEDNANYKPSKLAATYCANSNSVRLTYTKYSRSKNHYVISRAFNMDLNRNISDSPPPEQIVVPLLHHQEQNNLSIRIVHKHDHRIYELIYPIALHHNKPVDEVHLVARDNDGKMHTFGETDQFRSILTNMSASLECSPKELTNFVLEGVEIYERHAPEVIHYSPFTIGNE